jgi:hypothetical protein
MARETSGLIPKAVYTVQVSRAPTIINSPWAMFNTLATPYCRLSPIAIREYMPPINKPAITMSKIRAISMIASYLYQSHRCRLPKRRRINLPVEITTLKLLFSHLLDSLLNYLFFC